MAEIPLARLTPPAAISFEREAVTETTRELLCDIASGDLERQLGYVAADWDDVFAGLGRNGLLGLAHARLKRHGGDYPPASFRQRVKEAHTVQVLQMAVAYHRIGRVLRALTRAGIDFMVVKGPAVAYTVYPDPSMRYFNDLDVVARERDWREIHELLLGLGFVQRDNVSQPPPKLFPQSVTYELQYWHPTEQVAVEVHFEDLLNAGLASRGIEAVWNRAKVVHILGIPIQVMSLEDQLIHLCAHAHYHGYTRLNWFSDLAFIVRDHRADVSWSRVLEAVRVEEAEVPVYYTLRFLELVCGVEVPAPVLAALRPGPLRRWLHEHYLPEEKVISLQPMYRPDFSFFFMPLFKRFLPDLLVMGRRQEKLRYLPRIVVPPPAWLRHYYLLGEADVLAVHYVLHPLKLAYHYLAEMTHAVFAFRLPKPTKRQSATALPEE